MKFQIPNSKFQIRRAVVLLLMAAVLGFAPTARAGKITLEMTVDRSRVSPGEGIQLSLIFSGTQNISAPELPPPDGFQSRYLGPSRSVSIVNGRISSSITHMYSLIPLRAGKFTIGPFSFDIGGSTYTTGVVQVEVAQGAPPAGSGGSAPPPEQPELEDRIFAVLEVGKREVYLNEIIPVTVKLYINRLSVKEFQYPELELEGFSLSEFKDYRQAREVLGGVAYNVIVFDTAMFGIRPGEFVLGPARIECNLLVKKPRRRSRSMLDGFFRDDYFDDFFGSHRTYPIVVESAPVTLAVIDFPEEGKPEDFSGAIGDFRFTLDAGPKEIKAGDPITVKMKIEGEGNFGTVTPPRLESREGFKVYDPEARREDGVKRFEQVLIPRSDAVTEVPPVSFSFFNPESETYRTIRRGPIPIEVAKPEKEEELKIVEMPSAPVRPFGEEKLGRDIIYIKDSPGGLREKGGYLHENRMYLLMHLLPLFVLAIIAGYQKRAERLKTDIRYARRLRAPAKARRGIAEAKRLLKEGKTDAFYDSVFRMLREYLGDRLHIASGGMTGRVVDDVLKNKRIKKDILEGIRSVFRDCDQARYAPAEFGKDRMEDTFRILREVIDYLERQKI